MNFPLQNRTRSRVSRTRIVLGVFVVIALALFAGNYFSGGAVSGFAQSGFATLHTMEIPGSGAVASVQEALTSKRALISERERLEARVHELELYALNNLVLASENKELRALLGSATTTNKGVLGRIVSNGELYPYGTLLVALDSEAVVSEGALVFGAGNVLVGTVIESGERTALVQLVSTPQAETPVLIGQDDRLTAAVLQGVGNGNMTAEVVRDADVRVGDPVVYLTNDTAIVGIVGAVVAKPADAFQLIRVRTPLNLSTVRFVHIR